MEITDLLLITSHQPDTARFLALSSGITQPLGVAYLAAYLIKHGYRVKILDNDILKLDRKHFADFVRAARPRYVGFSTFTNSFQNSLDYAACVKELGADTKVIMGGPHASALPGDVLKYAAVDIVVKGEGEATTLELLKALDAGTALDQIAGLAFKKNGRVVETPARPVFEDIDELPLPAYQLLPMRKYYLPASRRMGAGKIASIVTGRGCPYKCTFCSRAVFGKGLRLRKPENVVAEIGHLADTYGVREFLIWDDVFTADEGRAMEICRLIKRDYPGIVWSCSGRADRTSDELYKNMREAGCREILFGAESGSQTVLDDLKKDITPAQVETCVKLCRKHDIRAFCTFMLGSPAESRETLEQTLRFVKRLDPDYAIFCLLAPLPGSDLFTEILNSGKLDLSGLNWNNFISVLSSAPPPLQVGGLSRRELVRWQKKFFREFYLNPKYIARHIFRLRRAAHLYEALRGLVALLGHQLHGFSFDEE